MNNDMTTALFAGWNCAVSAGAILALGYSTMGMIPSAILGVLALSAFVTWATIGYYTIDKS